MRTKVSLVAVEAVGSGIDESMSESLTINRYAVEKMSRYNDNYHVNSRLKRHLHTFSTDIKKEICLNLR